MSWSIKAIGTPAAVKAAIQSNTNLAPTLMAALVEICDDKPWDGSNHDGLLIEGSGHSGKGSYIPNLKVERFTLAKEPTPAPVTT